MTPLATARPGPATAAPVPRAGVRGCRPEALPALAASLEAGFVARLMVGFTAALLGGCAYGPGPVAAGSSREQLQQQAGAPTGEYERAGQRRLEYATGPYGKHTWLVDLGADGRVSRVEQVLTDERFAQVQRGQKADEVRWNLGRPSETRSVRMDRQVWAYRYETPFCQWFVVTLEPDGTVMDTAKLPDPLCEAINQTRD